jgi:hypothetical protein
MLVRLLRRALAAACALAAANAAAPAAEYRDPNNVFAFAYDDKIWQTEIDKDGFGLTCRPDACKTAQVGCFVETERVPSGSVERIMKNLDSARIAREQLEVFAKRKAELEKTVGSAVTWDRTADTPPRLIAPYAAHRIGGHPALKAEFAVTMAGNAARYVSYLTAAGNHSIAVVCHAPDSAIAAWRPRFEALMAGFRPAPEAKKRTETAPK